MSTATLENHNVTDARVYIPAWGVPWAEVSLDSEATLRGRVTLKVADLVFVGTVMSGGIGPVGRSSFRLAAGAGMWGKKLPTKSYANDAGVKTSTVIADVARESGESVDAATLPAATVRLGYGWTREAAPASRILQLVATDSWYVDHVDGITKIGRRTASVPTAKLTVRSVDRARELVSLSADAIAELIPGATVEGLVAADVMHEVSAATGIETMIWGNGRSEANRALSALRRILEALDPARRYRAMYEYRVVSQEGERLNLQPIRTSTGMPDLPRVPVRPGIPGAKATHKLGARVTVGFVDASPAMPIVWGFEEADGEGFLPDDVTINASGDVELGLAVGRVLRVGDVLSISPGNGSGVVAGTVSVTAPVGGVPTKVKA